MNRVRHYSDPHQGLEEQLAELRGLVKIVPPLIEADRKRRWDEISSRWVPEDNEYDVIDTYEHEAGPEEGWGHADFAWTLYSTAIVTAWETFNVYLARQLSDACLKYNLSKFPVLAKLVEEERRTWDRRFDIMERRYDEFARIKLADLPGWGRVKYARELRNALVHNLGQYTRAYLKLPDAKRPSKDELDRFSSVKFDDQLVNAETIPLDLALTEAVIADLLRAGKAVAVALGGSDEKSGSST